MNIRIKKFQEGGPMAPAEGAPMEEMPAEGAPVEGAPEGAPEGGQDPIMQIAQVAMQALQSQDCEAAMAVCEAFVAMLQGGAEGAPEAAPEGEPVYRKGGKLVRRIR